MVSISNHTRLINACIGFCKGTAGWPSIFSDAGYRLERIESSFQNSDGDEVNPDLLLSSNRSIHVLVTECKGGTLSEDRFNKYSRISPSDLENMISKLHTKNGLSCENVYVGTKSLEDSYQILGVEDGGIIVTSSEVYPLNTFHDNELDKVIPEPVPIEGKPPVSYYPFSPDDSRALIAEKIAQEMTHLAVKGKGRESEFTPEELLKGAFDPYWDNISDSGQRELIKKVQDILNLFEERDVEGDLRAIEGNPVYYVKTSQALQRKIDEVIEELATDEDLDNFC